MDVSRFVVESAAFTRATLLGKPSRWLIFILLGLPWMALSSRLESWKILEGTTIHWNLIPWQEAGLLIGTGILCNLLVSGWIVRLLRDDPVPPDFDHPLLLCLDGMKFFAIPLVWMLVPSVLAFAQYSVAGGSTVSVNLWQPDPATIIILVLLALQIIILFIAVQYVTIGTIRFARTGSVREGLAVLEVRKTIGRIGIRALLYRPWRHRHRLAALFRLPPRGCACAVCRPGHLSLPFSRPDRVLLPVHGPFL